MSTDCTPLLACSWVEADTLPQLAFDWSTDITGYTIEVKIARPDATSLTKIAVIDDAVNGIFHVAWVPTDLIAGISLVEVRLIDGAGDVQTSPAFRIRVRKAVV